MKKSIAVIMAHADDIELSAGATLAKYIDEGYQALYGVLSRCNSGWTVNAEEGGHYRCSEEIIPRRRNEAEAAAEVFGAELYYGDLLENNHTTRRGFRIAPVYGGIEVVERTQVIGSDVDPDDIPAGSLFSTAAGTGAVWEDHPVIADLANILVSREPELVIGQPIGNLNPDHFLAAQILAIAWQLAVSKAAIGPYWLPIPPRRESGYVFPPLAPDRYVDTSGYEETCLRALACHVSQGGNLEERQRRRRAMWGRWREASGYDSAEAFLQIYPERSADEER